jgi:hypothetical protein
MGVLIEQREHDRREAGRTVENTAWPEKNRGENATDGSADAGEKRKVNGKRISIKNARTSGSGKGSMIRKSTNSEAGKNEVG